MNDMFMVETLFFLKINIEGFNLNLKFFNIIILIFFKNLIRLFSPRVVGCRFSSTKVRTIISPVANTLTYSSTLIVRKKTIKSKRKN